jgi:chromosome segregation ATPase
VKGLPTLIRLHRWRLDEKRKQLAALERLAAKLREQRRRLEEELRAEQDVARSLTGAEFTYAAYAKAVVQRRETLPRSIAEAEGQIERVMAEVTEAFRELKRYEVAQANRERAAEEEAARREQAVLDDVGANVYRRRETG